MQILAINGSRRKQGNTGHLIQALLEPARKSGAPTETIVLGDYDIGACTGCEGCRNSWECVIRDDFASIVAKMDDADGLILASPTYWYTVSSDMKRFIDRCYSLIQFPVSRQAWIGKYDHSGKAVVTAAVCEQHERLAMGNTLELLTDFSSDIGLAVVASVPALGFFEAGRLRGDRKLLAEAEKAGQCLVDRLRC